MLELWDAYDSNFNRIHGITLRRGETIPDGLYHLVCEILVKHADGSYLLMQRSANKHFGGLWEATAGGSALQGETPLECAARELREETGIVSDELIEVGRTISSNTRSIYVEFLCITSWDKENILLQEGETSDYRWVSKEDFIHMSPKILVTKRIQKFIEDLQGPQI